MKKPNFPYFAIISAVLFLMISIPVIVSAGQTSEPTGPPTITGFAPGLAVPSQDVEVYGTNLSGNIQLVSSTGQSINTDGSVDFQLTTAKFDVPFDTQPGNYKITVTNSLGSATTTQTLIIQVGGNAFPNGPTVTVPTQGLPTDLGQLIQQIFTWSLAVLGIAVFVMFFYAGFLWLTAAGNTARVGDAKSRMTNAVFGAILLLSSYLILNTINPNFVRNTFNLPGLQSSGGGGGNPPPPYTGPQPPNIMADVTAERAKYPASLVSLCTNPGSLEPSSCPLGTILNAVAWNNKSAGWGLSKKTGGHRCPSPAGEIACDILHYQPTNVIVDVLVAAETEGTPAWQVLGVQTDSSRPWVAPVQP